jgi:molybdate transport system ATP-binding protein
MIEIDIQRRLFGPDGELNLKFKTTIENGQFVTLYGPSGAGKSSVLKMLAGLMKPDGGLIQVANEIWYRDAKNNIFVTPQHRRIGMVFQEHSLFPNMTVRENLTFALEKDQSPKIVDELLQITELENLQKSRPSILSGGQKQRVALARALVRKPKLLLLDEPLSALDTELRRKLQDYILQVHQHFGLTTILVSHDLPEVIKMSKRVLVLENGVITKDGDPQKILL